MTLPDLVGHKVYAGNAGVQVQGNLERVPMPAGNVTALYEIRIPGVAFITFRESQVQSIDNYGSGPMITVNL